MKKSVLAAAVICAVCMTGCGNQASEFDGKVLMTQSTPAQTSAAESKTEASSAAEQTAPESSAAAESQPENTDAAPQTTVPQQTESTTAAASGQIDSAPDSSAPLAEKAKFSYNGCTFGVGDQFADISEKLGKQSGPVEKVQPCIPGASEITRYRFPGFIVETNPAGVISTICMTHDYDDSSEVGTVQGLHLGDKQEKVRAAMGEPGQNVEEMIYIYQDGDLSMSFNFDEGTVMSVNAENLEILMTN